MLRTICRRSVSVHRAQTASPKWFSSMEAAANTDIDSAVRENFGTLLSALKPKEVVDQLDKFIVGQPDAKRAVAIALRNRWRRHQLSDDLRNEVIPKNILMIGPTGCGKTEIARRIAKLSQAPFIKVEATKFTEVGFHGKDVDQIIKDLVEVSINMTKKRIREEVLADVATVVEDKLLDALLGTTSDPGQRESYRELLRAKELENRKVDVEVPVKSATDKGGVQFGGGDNAFMMIGDLLKTPGGRGKKGEKRNLKVSEARPLLAEAEVDRVVEGREVEKEAIHAVEQSGIVFIDEIDKLVSSSDYRGADASSEGVQRDLLPLIEGSTISTKHGNVNTDFILFIASGAFHSSKPSDLLAELQGRLPIRVTLKGLTEADLHKILTEPVTNLIRQQVALLKSEGVDLVFTPEAVKEIARVAFMTNKSVENIGARRLHTIIERVMEEISFNACDTAAATAAGNGEGGSGSGNTVEVTAEYVRSKVGDMIINADMRKYIL